jgi:hypothetical protein
MKRSPATDQIAVERQRRAVPHEPVDAISEQRRLAEHVRAGAGRALRPVEIDAWVRREVPVQGDPEQPALRAEVDGEIEHRRSDVAVHDPPNAAGVLLEDEDVVRAEKGSSREPPSRRLEESA